MTTQQIRIRLPEEEYKSVKKEMKERGLTLSQFFRILISDEQLPKTNSPKSTRKLYLDLAVLQEKVESMVRKDTEIDLIDLLEEIRLLRANCIGMEKVE